ncbi:hypothetical protein EJ02DRAFT_238242 [Clathrospora elynae]|uniref:Uncharacterized protein n=1 Tax=Clathrospora elynae TaxID=706981 RepID=A0A6A5SKN3_9PLEO|nr:hypothetical protein EJ02DRAFT_238242 [Clathrospora elynae]
MRYAPFHRSRRLSRLHLVIEEQDRHTDKCWHMLCADVYVGFGYEYGCGYEVMFVYISLEVLWCYANAVVVTMPREQRPSRRERCIRRGMGRAQ